MQRAGDERGVTSRVGKTGQIVGSANATAGDEHRARRSGSHPRDQIEIETSGGADPREVDHDHGACTGIGGVHEAAPGMMLVAGGGVRGLNDLALLANVGCDAALVATALHDGRLGPAEVAAAQRLGQV